MNNLSKTVVTIDISGEPFDFELSIINGNIQLEPVDSDAVSQYAPNGYSIEGVMPNIYFEKL